MLLTRATPPPGPQGSFRSASDDDLVRACLNGNEEAWAALIDRYKNLIYAVPIRGGASQEDASDIFQSVCLQLFSELPRLRNVAGLRSWLLTIAQHKLYELRQQRRRPIDSLDDPDSRVLDELGAMPPDAVEELDRDQRIRAAINELPDRCRVLVHHLFFEHPPRPYRDLARDLGLATGSIGFIRGRCLARLTRALRAIGLK